MVSGRRKETLWAGRTLHSLYEEAHTPWDWQPKLKVLAEELGMHGFSSPFDDTAVDFLETLDVPAYKVASFELVDIPLLKKMARTTKPMILSTGMATLSEIEEAVNAVRAEGVEDFALLKTNSAYPAPASEMNLQTIPHMAQAFGVPTGLSDHTLGISVPVAATALGATVIEKHMCLRRADGGPDAAFSLEPKSSRRWWKRCEPRRPRSDQSFTRQRPSKKQARRFVGRYSRSKTLRRRSVDGQERPQHPTVRWTSYSILRRPDGPPRHDKDRARHSAPLGPGRLIPNETRRPRSYRLELRVDVLANQ